MATCPNCGGKGVVTVVDPVPDYTDPMARVGFLSARCAVCNGTGSTPDGQAMPVPPPAEPRASWWRRLFG